jgi:mono/diheme cytochrome c family protein
MHRAVLVLPSVLALFALHPASAQSAAKKSTAPKKASAAKASATPTSTATTLAGVYTAEQADRGKDVYFGSCRSCHSPQSHTGATFNKWWRGKQLSDLYGFIATRMPKNDPGSLSPGDAADVVAYLLKMNAMPVGKGELVPDEDSLKHVRIETRRSTTPATRKKP